MKAVFYDPNVQYKISTFFFTLQSVKRRGPRLVEDFTGQGDPRLFIAPALRTTRTAPETLSPSPRTSKPWRPIRVRLSFRHLVLANQGARKGSERKVRREKGGGAREVRPQWSKKREILCLLGLTGNRQRPQWFGA